MNEIRYNKGRGPLLIGLVINTALTVFKFFAGFFGKSHVMIADAVHSLSDIVTDLIVLLGLKFSSKPKDEIHPYGHGKIETVSAGIIGTGLIIAGLKIGYEGIHTSLFHPKTVPTLLPLFAAVISILVKEGLYRYTVFVGKKIDSQVITANAWHHRSDALSSVAALVGIGGARLGFALLDPLSAVFVAAMVVKVGGEIILTSFKELIETSVDKNMIKEIGTRALSIPDVKEVHAIKARHVGSSVIVELHIEVDENMSVKKGHSIAGEVEQALKAGIRGIEIVTVHIEPAKGI